ncbi:MAG: hypothetical protein Q9187_002806 [Circinaria calcarea]
MSTSHPSKTLGPVVVVGGCGFIGFHIVCSLLEDPDCTSIAVFSRNPTRNRLPGVSYHAVDITDRQSVSSMLAKIQPRVIIHTASPTAFSSSASSLIHHNVNIDGTANLLACASETPSVLAFVFTSSTSVVTGKEYVNVDESRSILDASSKADSYTKSKAIAETLVLAANNPSADNGAGFRTASIRPCGVYGERDMQLISSALETLEKPAGARVQFGDNQNLVDWCYAGNAASAHVLAAKALLAGTVDPNMPKVDGEAFFITDGAPLPMWDFVRKIWSAAGDKTTKDQVWVIPAKVALALASTTDWLFWVFTLGTKQPYIFTRDRIEYVCSTRTFSIQKAKERLGYVPIQDIDGGIRKGVEWAMEQKSVNLRSKGKT